MKNNEIREIAMLHYFKRVKAKKADLVRAIQRAEGNPQCFDSNIFGKCGQERCLWRDDCLQIAEGGDCHIRKQAVSGYQECQRFI